MAIEFAHMRFISRSKGGNAVRAAAYNMRDSLVDERTGTRYSYLGRDNTLVHHEIVLPAGADNDFLSPQTLWVKVELAEHRKDSTVAWELTLALPSDTVISHADRVQLAKSFAHEHFVAKGLAAQIDIHGSHSRDSDKMNFHGHILLTTRRLDGDHLDQVKARDLEPRLRAVGGKPLVIEADHWGALWRDYQNAYFGAHGKTIRVDPRAPIPEEHLGPKRFQHPLSEKVQRVADIRQRNAKLGHVRQPQQIAGPVLNILKTAQKRLTFEAIASELNPRYAKAQRTLHKANADLRRAQQDHAVADYRINERWGEMGILGRAAHARWKPRMNRVQQVLYGAIRDAQLGEWEGRRGGALKRIRSAGKIIKIAEREVAKEFEAIRPAAEAELQRRRLSVENARVEIERAANSLKPARQSTGHRARL